MSLIRKEDENVDEYVQRMSDFGQARESLRQEMRDTHDFVMAWQAEEILIENGIFCLEDLINFDIVSLANDPREKAVRRLNALQYYYPYNSANFHGLSLPISIIRGLNKAKRNRLNKKGIKTIKDFIEIDISTILKFSYKDELLKIRKKLIDNNGFSPNTFSNIVTSLLINTADDPKKYEALYLRVSGQNTLEESAVLIGATRERVRQLETAFIKELKKFQLTFFQELEKIKSRRKDPITLINIEIELSYFQGITELIKHHKSPLFNNLFIN